MWRWMFGIFVVLAATSTIVFPWQLTREGGRDNYAWVPRKNPHNSNEMYYAWG